MRLKSEWKIQAVQKKIKLENTEFRKFLTVFIISHGQIVRQSIFQNPEMKEMWVKCDKLTKRKSL